MRRTLAFLSGVALLAGACGGTDLQPAAVVNGAEITQQDVADDLDAIERNEEFLEIQEASGRVVQGERSGTFDAAFAATVLNRRIQNLLVHQEVLDREIEVAGACRDAAREAVLNRLGGNDAEAGEAVLAAFPEPFRSSFVDAEADVAALQADLAGVGCLAEDSAEAYFEENSEQFGRACLAIIAVASQEEADAVASELFSGADFAAVADANTTGNTGPGGDVGCVFRAEFGPALPELAELVFSAQPGQVVGPVQGPAGFLFARVGELQAPDFDDQATRVQAQQAVAGAVEEAFQTWSQEAAASAEVDVDERYGRWDAATGQLVAPEPPAPTQDEGGTIPFEEPGTGDTVPTERGAGGGTGAGAASSSSAG